MAEDTVGGVRQCGHSQDVADQCSEPDESGEVFGVFFVASCHASELLESAEESFDMVSILITLLVVAFFDGSVFVGLDAGSGFEFLDKFASFIAIVGRVGEHVFDLALMEFGKQFAAVGTITVLARAELHADQVAPSVNSRMDLCIQASARPTEAAAIVGFLFFSPA